MTRAAKKHGRQKHDGRRTKQRVVRRAHSQKPQTTTTANSGTSRGAKPRQSLNASKPAKVPFHKSDRVLLVGEGDFSFALCLAQHYRPASLLATSFDSEQDVYQKYSRARDTVRQLGGRAGNHSTEQNEKDEFLGFSPPCSPQTETSPDRSSDRASTTAEPSSKSVVTVLYGIDATKLSTAYTKLMRRHGPFTKIVFNFPHVGGLSTDVNRQTRANQKLLQGFFAAAKPLLASAGAHGKNRIEQSDRYDTDDEYESSNSSSSPVSGQILVSLFEGEAYTDWNIRDIARSQGLKVVESFGFPWSAYPGYHHARTIGEIKTGKGGWKGEDRAARCFVFELKDTDVLPNVSFKRKRDEIEDEDSD